jgi:hypothetical protein
VLYYAELLKKELGVTDDCMNIVSGPDPSGSPHFALLDQLHSSLQPLVKGKADRQKLLEPCTGSYWTVSGK